MFWLTVLMALREIRRNVLRSALTMLGMVIGVGAVIALVSVGQGATAKVTSDIGKMGNNLLMVFPGSGHRRQGMATQAAAFTLDDVSALAALPGVAAAAPTGSASKLVVFGNENTSSSITGTTPDYLTIRDYALESGRVFSEADITGGNPVCIVDATTRTNMFADADPIGESIRVGHVS